MARSDWRVKRPLWRVSVTTANEAEDAVQALLEAATGHFPSSYANAKTGVSQVSVFMDEPPGSKRLQALRAGLQRIAECGLCVGEGRLEVRRVRKEDWSESWKKHFQPIEIGDALLVKPSWIRQRAKRGQAVVVLDPGLSFGTGQHPTTSFCLRQLTAWRRAERNQSMLDIGTGSGILAIAAAKLGYEPVVALEIDPEAVRIARENCARNRVSERLVIHPKDLAKVNAQRLGRFDVVCANLSDDLLIRQRDRIVRFLKAQGRLVLAGILAQRFGEVEKWYAEKGFKLVATQLEGEWQSGTFGKKR